jgi:hypothetical protein
MISTMAVVLLVCFQTLIRESRQEKDQKYVPKVNLLEPKGFSVTIEGNVIQTKKFP